MIVDGSAEGLAALAAFGGQRRRVGDGRRAAADGERRGGGRRRRAAAAGGGEAGRREGRRARRVGRRRAGTPPRRAARRSARRRAARRASARSPRGGLAYAGDVSPEQIAAADEVVITDSNRRRVLVPSRLAQNAGPVLSAAEEPSVDAAVLNPFAALGPDAQTVAVYDGIEAVTAPSSPGFPQFPENRPFAALDGDEATHWQADRALLPERHVLSVTFDAPRDIDTLELLPYNDRRATVLAVEVQGRRFPVEPGWNRLAVDLEDVKTLTVRIAAVRKPADETAGAGGIRELRIAGLHPREALRPPTLAERSVAPDAALTYLFQRTTGDDPFRRTPKRGASGRRARARPARRRDRHHARLQPAHRADVHGRRLGERRRRGPRRRTRPAGRRPDGLHELGPLRGPSRLPREQRVRRHGPTLDRRLPRRPLDLDRVGRARADDQQRSRSSPCRACGGRPASGSWSTGSRQRPWTSRATRSGCRSPSRAADSGSRSSGRAAIRRPRGSAARSPSPRSAAPRPGPTSRAPAT